MNITEFNTIIKNNCVVVFSSKQCQPCKVVIPILKELTKGIKFVKIDVQENPKIATKYNVMSVPSTFIFKKGKVVESVYGNPGKIKLKKLINSLKN